MPRMYLMFICLCKHWRFSVFNFVIHFFLKVKRQPECRRHFKAALLRLLPGRFVPRCKADGSYDPTQCAGSVCLCVDSRGIAIPGTSKARFKQQNCESQGKIVLLQLQKILVWLFLEEDRLLSYFKHLECSSGWRLTTCQRHFQQASRSSSFFIPKCRHDGRYKDVQCYGSTCFCVGRNGLDLGLKRTLLPQFPTCPLTPGKEIKFFIRIRRSAGFYTLILPQGSLSPNG